MNTFLNNYENLDLAKIKIELDFKKKLNHYDNYEKIKFNFKQEFSEYNIEYLKDYPEMKKKVNLAGNIFLKFYEKNEINTTQVVNSQISFSKYLLFSNHL